MKTINVSNTKKVQKAKIKELLPTACRPLRYEVLGLAHVGRQGEAL